MRRRRPSLMLSVLIATAALPALAAGMYRWVDAQGVVHFSQSPPAGQHYQRFQPDVAPPTSAPGVAGMDAYSKHYDAQQAAEAKAQQTALRQKAERAEACAKARQRISTLQQATAHRLFVENSDGTRSRMTEAQFDTRLQQAQAQASASCDH